MSDSPLNSKLSHVTLVVINVCIFRLARFVRVDAPARRWCCVCICIVRLTPLALCNFALGRLIFVLDDGALAPDGVTFLANISVCIVWQGVSVARMMDIVFGTLFSSMVNVSYWSLLMHYGPCAP